MRGGVRAACDILAPRRIACARILLAIACGMEENVDMMMRYDAMADPDIQGEVFVLFQRTHATRAAHARKQKHIYHFINNNNIIIPSDTHT